MATLESKSKLGYYPTPIEVVKHIKNMLNIQKHSKLLDPCCGDGDALQRIAKGTGAVTYGIEIDKVRAQAAEQKLNFVINADAINNVKITNNGFDLLFLNPPYDYDIKEEGEGYADRIEAKFLRTLSRVLANNGVLVYIIPFNSLKKIWKFLTRFHDLRVMAFPEKYYYDYKQIVVIGRYWSFLREEERQRNTSMMINILKYVNSENACEMLFTTENVLNMDDFLKYEITPSPVQIRHFSSLHIDPEDAAKIIASSKLWDYLRSETTLPEKEVISPLFQPKQGHIAMLLAGGYMNGKIETDEGTFVIKGITDVSYTKEETEEEEVIDGKVVLKEITKVRRQHTVNIKAFDIKNNKFITMS